MSMNVRFKTKEQLEATGWTLRTSDGSWILNSTRGNAPVVEVVTSAMLGWGGKDLNAPDLIDGGFTYDNKGITPSMLLVGLVKTKDQLLESGYTAVGSSFKNPDDKFGWGSDHTSRMGKYVPIHAKSEDGGNIFFTHLSSNWSITVLVVDPTVKMWFGPGKRQEPAAEIVKPNIIEFRDAPYEKALDLITCGFELETQDTDGRGFSRGLPCDPIDKVKSDEAMLKQMDKDTKTIQKILEHWDGPKPKWLANKLKEFGAVHVRASFDHLGLKTMEDLIREELMTPAVVPAIKAKIEEKTKMAWDSSPYRLTPKQVIRQLGNIPDTVDVGEDGSVKGFEFRTVGAMTVKQFKEAADSVFKLPHLIDHLCSFHIHLAVKGVKHEHGDWMQMAITEYLIENMNRVPLSVRARWAKVRENNYIAPGIRKQKYSFVWRHERLKTWEFRGFGNVKNVEDAMICLQLAIEAMQYAYKVVTGKVELISDQRKYNGHWRELVYKALVASQSITEAVPMTEPAQVTEQPQTAAVAA